MKLKYIIILVALILFTIIFFPITISEPYNTMETYEENYTVIEPKDVQVADWIKENVVVNQSYMDIRYSQRDLKFDASMLKCSNSTYNKIDLAVPDWGKINTINYGSGTYFAGYFKGHLSKKNINSFDIDTRKGHIYKIIRNEKVDITLKQGEYLPLYGYSIQVNKISDNLKSSRINCDRGSEYGDSDTGGSCTTTIEYYQGASLSLSDMNIEKTWDVKNGSTLTYEKTLSGGESLTMVAVHIKEVTNSSIVIDGIFQISNDYVNTAGGLGTEVIVNIMNTDSQPGTFDVYTGFILNSSLGFEIGGIHQVFLNSSESMTLFYNTDKNIENCRYYVQTSKTYIPENFTNFRNINFSKRKTEYRNVTLYVDMNKTRIVERNITKYKNKTVYGLFNILRKNK